MKTQPTYTRENPFVIGQDGSVTKRMQGWTALLENGFEAKVEYVPFPKDLFFVLNIGGLLYDYLHENGMPAIDYGGKLKPIIGLYPPSKPEHTSLAHTGPSELDRLAELIYAQGESDPARAYERAETFLNYQAQRKP